VNTAQRLFFHLLSSMIRESAIGRTSTNFSLIHLSVVPVQVRKRQRRKLIRWSLDGVNGPDFQEGGITERNTAVGSTAAEMWDELEKEPSVMDAWRSRCKVKQCSHLFFAMSCQAWPRLVT
jgi:hypothetical protein